MSLRSQLIRLAFQNPEIRERIIPLLREAGSATWNDRIDRMRIQFAAESAREFARTIKRKSTEAGAYPREEDVTVVLSPEEMEPVTYTFIVGPSTKEISVFEGPKKLLTIRNFGNKSPVDVGEQVWAKLIRPRM